MNARVKEVEATWSALLQAVLRHVAEAPIGEFAQLDVERLRQAANTIAIRMQEASDNKK